MNKRDENDQADLGNPLGLGGPITKEPGDTIASGSDDPEVRRRRARAGLGPDADDRTTNGMGDLNVDPDGAAGIDMGYGGEGTDITTRKR